LSLWQVRADDAQFSVTSVVGPTERVGWTATIGLGVQHLAAMFAAGIFVPTLTGLPVTTTLLFSGVGSLVFLAVTRNRLPGYLGASFAFLAPLSAARSEGIAAQLGGVLAAGLLLTAIGVVVKSLGPRFLEAVIPPAVAGALVLLVGVNVLQPTAGLFGAEPWTAVVTAAVIVLAMLARGVLRRFAVTIGLIVGCVAAAVVDGIPGEKLDAVGNAAWLGMPELHGPQLNPDVVLAMLPAVLVLAAEYIAHLKAIASATGTDLDHIAGDSLIAGGLSTAFAGFGGGVPMTNSVTNLGVLAASRVYSTAPCAAGGVAAVVLAFCPKFTALINTVPPGVLAGGAFVLVGMIVRIGLRIWQRNGVSLRHPLTLALAFVALVAGVGGFSLDVGIAMLDGVAWGALLILIGYPIMHGLLAHTPMAGGHPSGELPRSGRRPR
jgi:uracil-xanthine permease